MYVIDNMLHCYYNKNLIGVFCWHKETIKKKKRKIVSRHQHRENNNIHPVKLNSVQTYDETSTIKFRMLDC